MSTPPYAPPRFTLFHALGLMLGFVVIDAAATLMVGLLYQFGPVFGIVSGPEGDASRMILTRPTSTAIIAGLVMSHYGESWRQMGFLKFKPLVLLGFIPIIVSMPVFISEVDNLLRYLGAKEGLDQFDYAQDLGNIVGMSWQGPFLAVIVASITEEIVFRGIILRGLLNRWPAWAAILASALLFTVMHMNPAQAPIAFGLGLVLGWVYTRTRSLGLCMAGHALNNAAPFFAIDYVPFAVDNYNHVPEVPGGFFHPWWFDLAGLALFALGLGIMHAFLPAGKARPPAPPRPPRRPTPHDGKSLGDSAVLGEGTRQMSVELVQLVTSLAQRARAASLALATAPTAKKDAALAKLADLIDSSHEPLLAANARDLASPEAIALTAASRDRLTLDAKRLTHLSESVREVIALPDPVGELLDETTRPNGLRIRKLRVPIGVIGIIYESRPNVTVDCAILCLKSGNASILRGGKECFHTNTALAGLIQQALVAAELPADAVQLVPTTDRAALTTLLKLDTLIHCIIPRGGETLIRYVAENSTIPVIKHYKGVCFVYVDRAADLAMAEAITLNAKVQRPSACNAAEQLLVHRDIAEKFLPDIARALIAKNVQLRCDAASAAILDRATIASAPATAADYTSEFLDYVIAIRVVDSLDSAVGIINRDSSNHSDAIVTADEAAGRRFLAEIDSATVYWNASTRFTDGFEFGYGAEIGISTDRLHARGPMGLRELCSYKFAIEGNGQVRS